MRTHLLGEGRHRFLVALYYGPGTALSAAVAYAEAHAYVELEDSRRLGEAMYYSICSVHPDSVAALRARNG